MITNIKHAADVAPEDPRLKLVETYREKVESEMKSLCDHVITLVSDNILPHATTAHGRVFFLKLKADYQRYLAEFSASAERRVRSCGVACGGRKLRGMSRLRRLACVAERI